MTASATGHRAASAARRVLVLGARGRFGAAAARAFSDAGWQVVAQLRPGAALPAALARRAAVQALTRAIDDQPAIAAAAAGATVVVQGLSPAYTHRAWRRDLARCAEAGLAAARTLGATLLVPGTVYNFGPALPAVLREGAPQNPATFQGRMRHAQEQALEAAAHTPDGPQVVVLRAGDFFGSGDGSWLDLALAKRLRNGRFEHPAAPGIATAWAYLPDLARAFVAVAAQRERLGAFTALHFAGHTLDAAQWQAALTAEAQARGYIATGAALRAGRTPWPLLRVLGVFVPTLRMLVGVSGQWARPHRLDNTHLQALIGVEPHTPFASAVSDALDALGYLPATPDGLRAAA